MTPVAVAFAYLVLRLDPAAFTGYAFGWDQQTFGNSRARIVKFAGGVTVNLIAHASIDIAPGDVIAATAVGTALALFQNGIQILTVSDASFATGQWGLDSLSLIDLPAFEDFSGGTP